MKTMDVLTTLYQHHLWANLRLLECCASLTPAQLEATHVGAYDSIIEILRHITGGEQSYFSRISTGKQLQRPADQAPLTMAQMEESLRRTGAGFMEWAAKVQPGDTVEVDWDGTMRDVPKTILLTQVINHGTEHREQIKMILTQLGIEAPDLQGWAYFDAMDQQQGTLL
jgi:uncharacterized damage-inducible protein DinB